jgi:hypothetical protein
LLRVHRREHDQNLPEGQVSAVSATRSSGHEKASVTQPSAPA